MPSTTGDPGWCDKHSCDMREVCPKCSERPQRFVCRDCGYGVKADEDGCCTTCGRDCAIVELVSVPEDWDAEAALWGVWITSTCDRDSDDGWLHDSTMRKPFTGTEDQARAYAMEMAALEGRSRFGHEARPYTGIPGCAHCGGKGGCSHCDTASKAT